MPSHCVSCAAPVDGLRNPVRIVDGRVVVVCRGCAGLAPAGEDARAVTCGFCAQPAPAWLTEAVVTGGGVVKARCRSCRDAPAPVPAPVAPLPVELRASKRRNRRWPVFVAGVGVTAAASLYAWVGRGSPLELAASAAPAPRLTEVRTETVLVPLYLPMVVPAPSRAHEPPVPAGTTVHPLAGADRVMPGASSGSFGAERSGDRPIECGAGHCGVDLVADVGTPVLAARAGTVVSVHRDASGRGGRWVKVEHRGDVATLYFHLDEIRGDLAEGVHVDAGEPLGTLGRTGVTSSPTHLHFAVMVGSAYVDPVAMLRSARVVTAPPSSTAGRRLADAR